MNNGLEIEYGAFGLRAVAHQLWCDEMTEYVIAHQEIVELELNSAKGWQGEDLFFLKSLYQLRSFEILDMKISSIEPIHFLVNLRNLNLVTYCTTAIDFGCFPFLESCSLEWRPNAVSLFECTTLRSLFLNRYDGTNAKSIGRLVELQSLALLNSPLNSILAFASLKKLRFLRLANLKRLRSLVGIDSLMALEHLAIQSCRGIGSIDEISNLRSLRRLELDDDGNIASLKPIEHLAHLELVIFTESTNILDGDISPLLKLEHLRRVAFRDRRHYSNKRADFGVIYSR